MSHAEVVRRFYDRFNQKDFDLALEDFDPGVELWDTILRGRVVKGRDAVGEQWRTRFQRASAHFVIEKLIELDETVMVSVHIQPYTEHGASFGHAVDAVYRFTFREDLVVSLEARTLKDVPQSVRTLFGVN